MKKRHLSLIGLSLLTLLSCTNNKSSMESSTTSSSYSSPIISSEKEKESTSSTIVVPPVINKDTFSYLLGTYYAKGMTLSFDEDKLTITGDVNLKIIPTEVRTDAKTIGEDETETEYLVCEFSEVYNDGKTYEAYVDFEDGLLHVDQLILGEAKTIGTFMPDISFISGAYSFDGSGSSYNNYLIIDGGFDLDRGSFKANNHYGDYYSNEEYWHYTSYYKKEGDTVYTMINQLDGDDYNFGPYYIIQKEEKTYFWDSYTPVSEFDPTGTSMAYVNDVGGFGGITLFDGKNSITTSIDTENRKFTYGDKEADYTYTRKEDGYHLICTIDGKETDFQMGNYHMKKTVDGKTTSLPFNNVEALEGEYEISGFKFSYKYDWDTDGYVVKFNDKVMSEYSYVIHNDRKAIKFTVDGKDYIISPDLAGSSVRLDTDNTIFYLINMKQFSKYYIRNFVAHDDKHDFTLNIDSDMSFIFDGKTGKAEFVYHRGDKYPSLNLKTDSDTYILSLKDNGCEYYTLTKGSEVIDLFSEDMANKIYDEYTTSGKDNLFIDREYLTLDGKSYVYSFVPFYQEKSGTYDIAIATNAFDNELIYNQYGTLYTEIDENTTKYYVTTSTLEKIAGSYSLNGKYGVENIKFTSDGKLTLDSLNATTHELIRDVEYNYSIMTNGEDYNAVIGFAYSPTTTVYIYFYANYVAITGLKYYRSEQLSAFGTYSDGTDVIYYSEDTLYVNGEKKTIGNIASDFEKTIIQSGSDTYTFYTSSENNNVTLDNASTAKKLDRKLSFDDLSKYVGTYTINSTEVKVTKNQYSGYDVSVAGSSMDNKHIELHDGKLALTFGDFSCTYYLMLDEETGKITTDYQSASIPTPPPLPTF